MYALTAKYLIDRGLAAQHLKDRGISLPLMLLKSEIDRVLSLHAQGHSFNKIGTLVERAPKTTRSLLRRRGVLD